MTRLQTVLLIVLAFMTALALVQADWFQFFPYVMVVVGAIASWMAQAATWVMASSALIPGWVWWAIFGIAISRCMACGGGFGRGCCGSRHRSWKAAKESA